MITRRQSLTLAGAAALVPGPLPLREAAAQCGVLYGAAVSVRALARDPAYAACVARECAIVVPDLAAKFAATEPEDGQFQFAELDAFMAFAGAHRMRVRLHNLVWGVYNPAWLDSALRAARGDAVLRQHIETVVGRYRGRVLAWDVVNEPSDPRWNEADGLVALPWKRALGAGYFDEAFALAHGADPNAVLFVNDDLLEYADAASAAKRDGYLRLIEKARRRGAPLGGFGLEAHLRPERPFAPGPYRRFLSELAGMGLVLHVTELDVCDRTMPPGIGPRDAEIAACAKAFLDVVLDESAVRAVLTWGITTRYSWLATTPDMRRPDGLPPRGLPLDTALQQTGMRRALLDAFAAAPSR